MDFLRIISWRLVQVIQICENDVRDRFSDLTYEARSLVCARTLLRAKGLEVR